MSITSLFFILFIFAVLILYYIVPKKFQWIVLLAASVGFYLSLDVKGFIFVLATAGTIYGATLWMSTISKNQKKYIKENKATLTKEEKSEYKKRNKQKRKRIMICTLILNVGILAVLKYTDFALNSFSSLLGLFGHQASFAELNFIVPLGLSYYTFQSVGYLVDVYWEKTEAQKNFCKTLLFVSFFPQITQGPISEYNQLAPQFFSAHSFNYKNFSYGFQRIIWGFFKKMVIADTLSPYIRDILENYNSYIGITCFIAMLGHTIQLYADFSGYMDIMCGICETFDIKLSENFNRPFFSKSIAELWRRWHITLGVWLKKYIYFPIGVSKWAQKLGKNAESKFGKTFGNFFPATIALVVVWFTTGLWHGASVSYIVWGLLNGLVIIFSLWMEPVYNKVNSIIGWGKSNVFRKAFQILRTFLLFSAFEILTEVGTLKDGFRLWGRILTNHKIPGDLKDLVPALARADRVEFFIVLILGLGLMLTVSLIQRKKDIRPLFNKAPYPLRILILIFMIFIIASIGIPHASDGGFMYARF